MSDDELQRLLDVAEEVRRRTGAGVILRYCPDGTWELELAAPAGSPAPRQPTTREEVRDAILAFLGTVPKPVKARTIVANVKPSSRTTMYDALQEMKQDGTVKVLPGPYYWPSNRPLPEEGGRHGGHG